MPSKQHPQPKFPLVSLSDGEHELIPLFFAAADRASSQASKRPLTGHLATPRTPANRRQKRRRAS